MMGLLVGLFLWVGCGVVANMLMNYFIYDMFKMNHPSSVFYQFWEDSIKGNETSITVVTILAGPLFLAPILWAMTKDAIRK